jgi:hypothetical protein
LLDCIFTPTSPRMLVSWIGGTLAHPTNARSSRAQIENPANLTSPSCSQKMDWPPSSGPKLSRTLDRSYLTRQRSCDLAPQRSCDLASQGPHNLTWQRLDHLAGQRSNNLPRQRWDDLRQPRSTNDVGCCMGGGEAEAEENGRENRLVHILGLRSQPPPHHAETLAYSWSVRASGGMSSGKFWGNLHWFGEFPLSSRVLLLSKR